MILIDTSVWVDHFHGRQHQLVAALEQEQIVTHPFVIGELACGNIRARSETLSMLKRLPTISPATDSDALALIELRGLMRRGLTYGDVHLLASAAITDGVWLWTNDKKLRAAAEAMNLAYRP